MNAPFTSSPSLSARIAATGLEGRWLWDGLDEISLTSALTESRLGGQRKRLAGRSVMIRTRDQLSAALMLIELDGLAGRLVLCPPDLEESQVPLAVEDAGVEVIVGDGVPGLSSRVEVLPLSFPRATRTAAGPGLVTEWVLFTSGTTGRPKMVSHTLAGLVGAISIAGSDAPPIWGTFYDIRRYGGLQMLLRAYLGRGSMVLSRAEENVAAFLLRLGSRGVTHLTATPSHWRKALMSPEIASIAPRYVRLSGEIADQSILDRLKAQFPGVPLAHAYASTEAGVGFEVVDGLEGFPEAFLGRKPPFVEMKVVDDSLRVRSPRTASRYLGASGDALVDESGFVDTGDLVEVRDGRFYFMGRRGGVINVGGLKIHPEEVEAVINRQAGVRMSLVKARKSPITGAIVVADVVAEDGAPLEPLKAAILGGCRAVLPPFKTPASIRFVAALDMTPGGKLDRAGA